MHKQCPNSFHENPELVKTQKDKDLFYEYIKKIYGQKYNYQLINTQAESYIKQYGYTWSGMAGTLHWFYDLNHGNIEEGHGGIGIIPYVYDQAKEYYITITKANETNKNKQVMRESVYFSIQSPRAWQQPPQLMDMEDE